MATKKYVSPSKLSIFLDNLKNIFAPLSHKHTTSDITDYVVDSSLSSTSTNPIQNKVINAEFDAVSEAMGALEAAIDEKLDTSTASSTYETKEDATTKLNEAKSYTDIEIDKLSDTVAFIDSTDNESVSDANNTLTTAHIVDGLNSSSSSMVLSAKQGKVLNERINTLTSLEEELEDARIDKDGNTHDNVGEHIRNVTSQLSEEIEDLKENGGGGNVDLTGYATEEFVENAIIENAFYKPIPIESIEPNSTGTLVYYNINIENLDKNISYYFNPKEVADYPNARIHMGRVRLLCDDGSYASITNISPSTKTTYFLEKPYDTKWNWISDNGEITIDFTDRSTSSKVVKTQNYNRYYLSIGNNAEYVPPTDYSPASKKYVDDLIAELEARITALEG